MRNEPNSVHFYYQNVVYDTDFLALDELDHPLMSQYIYLEADTFAFIDMPCLGEEFDIEGFSFYLSCSLRMDIPSNKLIATRVYPLPFLAKLP